MHRSAYIFNRKTALCLQSLNNVTLNPDNIFYIQLNIESKACNAHTEQKGKREEQKHFRIYATAIRI